jgi:hypothetical protein
VYGGSRACSPLHLSQGVAREPEYNFVRRCGAKKNGFQGASSGDRFLVGVRRRRQCIQPWQLYLSRLLLTRDAHHCRLVAVCVRGWGDGDG